MTNSCRHCAEIKPRFIKSSNPGPHIIKATSPFERLSVDFKGPSNTKNKYILTVIDEFSRFPFAFACHDMTSNTVIKHLDELFMLFGMPAYMHSDRGTCFLSNEIKEFLFNRGIATSRTTSYNPQGNGQVERLNSTLWRTVQLALKTRGLSTENWEMVLPHVLHSIRSLLCTATNCTPHERMFKHQRRSTNGNTIPSWLLNSDQALIKKFNRANKYQALVEEVELLHVNPDYSYVRMPDGRETTVSNRHLAPSGAYDEGINNFLPTNTDFSNVDETSPEVPPFESDAINTAERGLDLPEVETSTTDPQILGPQNQNSSGPLRRTSRERRPPSYLNDYVTS
ncbi:hypothetical protein K1T71_011883 [Dendrolimus kikuchii]|uniref:Uncharacterized protein n=1 Tax=Dendrolimus kikuchii TaxID=765133 RepID=A0ACC1CMA6_9NEOP|nr:hypothetical protein K1T71_011883 [Dendrolimus kikuchii]